MLAQTEGVRDLSLTTNGVLLDRLAGPLVEAGLQRLNVSLDSLNHVRFAEITRRDALDAVLRGLDEAERYPELRPIKINCVAVKGFTETEVPALAELARRKPYVVRFIEFMPLDADEAWREDDVLTGAEIRADHRERARPSGRAPRQGLFHGPTLPLRGRRGRARVCESGLRALLLQLRPHPHHCRRAAPYVPFLTKGMGPENALARGRRRPGTGRAPPFCRAAQGAETQDQRPRIRASLAFNVANRRMRPHAGDF